MPDYPVETYNGADVRYVVDANGRIVGFYNPNTNDGTYAPWDDLRFPSQSINPAGAVNAPTVDTTAYPGTLLFDNAATNLIAGIAQLPHAWDKGSDLHPHVHWSKTTSASGGVVWEWCYAVAEIGGTFGAYSAWAQATSVVAHADTAHKHALDAFPALVIGAVKESTLIAWQVRRKHDATGDTYAAAARLWEFDIHYQVGKLGTVPEIPD